MHGNARAFPVIGRDGFDKLDIAFFIQKFFQIPFKHGFVAHEAFQRVVHVDAAPVQAGLSFLIHDCSPSCERIA